MEGMGPRSWHGGGAGIKQPGLASPFFFLTTCAARPARGHRTGAAWRKMYTLVHMPSQMPLCWRALLRECCQAAAESAACDLAWESPPARPRGLEPLGTAPPRPPPLPTPLFLGAGLGPMSTTSAASRKRMVSDASTGATLSPYPRAPRPPLGALGALGASCGPRCSSRGPGRVAPKRLEPLDGPSGGPLERWPRRVRSGRRPLRSGARRRASTRGSGRLRAGRGSLRIDLLNGGGLSRREKEPGASPAFVLSATLPPFLTEMAHEPG